MSNFILKFQAMNIYPQHLFHDINKSYWYDTEIIDPNGGQEISTLQPYIFRELQDYFIKNYYAKDDLRKKYIYPNDIFENSLNYMNVTLYNEILYNDENDINDYLWCFIYDEDGYGDDKDLLKANNIQRDLVLFIVHKNCKFSQGATSNILKEELFKAFKRNDKKVVSFLSIALITEINYRYRVIGYNPIFTVGYNLALGKYMDKEIGDIDYLKSGNVKTNFTNYGNMSLFFICLLCSSAELNHFTETLKSYGYNNERANFYSDTINSIERPLYMDKVGDFFNFNDMVYLVNKYLSVDQIKEIKLKKV